MCAPVFLRCGIRQALDNLCALSKEKTRSIISNFTTPATFFTGRAAETEAIRSKLSECGRVILQGVGGIGKSSLALHYADAARKAYQTIVYLEYHGSFADMAEDIAIDGVSQNLSAKEKLKILRELCSEKTLVILDNLDGMEHAELEADWLSLPCHLIMTARGSAENTVTLHFRSPVCGRRRRCSITITRCPVQRTKRTSWTSCSIPLTAIP